MRVTRERATLDDELISTETAYYLTSLPTVLATTGQLDGLVRGHWGIESVPRGHARSDRKEVVQMT